MDDSPEIVKMIKYILFGILLSEIILGFNNGQPVARALVTEPPSVVPVPFNQPEPEDFSRSDLISSFTRRDPGPGVGMRSVGMTMTMLTHMTPPHVKPAPGDLDPDASPMSGGHKEVRQAPPPPDFQQMQRERPQLQLPPLNSNSNPNSRPPLHPPTSEQSHNERDGFGSLCSIFRTFLEPRRFHRCHVSNSNSNSNSNGHGVMSPSPHPHGPPPQQQPHNYFERPGHGPPHPNLQPRPLNSNDLELASDDHHQHQHQHHQIMISGPGPGPSGPPQGQIHNHNHNHNQNHNHDLSEAHNSPTNIVLANKRYDHIEDIHINHSGEEDGDEHPHPHLLHHPGLGPPPHPHQDPTKISEDRSMILVPGRTCPPGQRRDPRGYCRRLVKIRTNYQYGPPQNIVRPIPIRYYYSRIVTIPALHFFFPN